MPCRRSCGVWSAQHNVVRILAIDPGERRLGLAVSDPTGVIALPLEVLERAGWAADLARLRRVIETHGVTEIVVGRPLTLRGEVGTQARAAARFAARVRAALALPVTEVDERLTTAAAERAVREETPRGSRKRAAVTRRRRDAIAAALILQPYLDRRRLTGPLRG
ncbi:MAG TPA: Holliday junction resolvase RuvX [bacterium]|nr:Holliday junction resolvase RuvX [bacterium]